jgi:hypothetical protein
MTNITSTYCKLPINQIFSSCANVTINSFNKELATCPKRDKENKELAPRGEARKAKERESFSEQRKVDQGDKEANTRRLTKGKQLASRVGGGKVDHANHTTMLGKLANENNIP